MEEHAYSLGEIFLGVIGVLLTISFGGWAAVVKRSADEMTTSVKLAVSEIAKLREEIHKDRVLNERRFTRLEQAVGLRMDRE